MREGGITNLETLHQPVPQHGTAGGSLESNGNAQISTELGKSISLRPGQAERTSELMQEGGGKRDTMIEGERSNQQHGGASGTPCTNRSMSTSTATNGKRKRKKVQSQSSQYKGVQWDRNVRRWRARLYKDRTRHLGYFDTEEEAAMAWDLAALHHFGLEKASNRLNLGKVSLNEFLKDQQAAPETDETAGSEVEPRLIGVLAQESNEYQMVVGQRENAIATGNMQRAAEDAYTVNRANIETHDRWHAIANVLQTEYHLDASGRMMSNERLRPKNMFLECSSLSRTQNPIMEYSTVVLPTGTPSTAGMELEAGNKAWQNEENHVAISGSNLTDEWGQTSRADHKVNSRNVEHLGAPDTGTHQTNPMKNPYAEPNTSAPASFSFPSNKHSAQGETNDDQYVEKCVSIRDCQSHVLHHGWIPGAPGPVCLGASPWCTGMNCHTTTYNNGMETSVYKDATNIFSGDHGVALQTIDNWNGNVAGSIKKNSASLLELKAEANDLKCKSISLALAPAGAIDASQTSCCSDHPKGKAVGDSAGLLETSYDIGRQGTMGVSAHRLVQEGNKISMAFNERKSPLHVESGVWKEGEAVWRAALTIDLGTFPSLEEAMETHDRASLMSTGFFGRLYHSLPGMVLCTGDGTKSSVPSAASESSNMKHAHPQHDANNLLNAHGQSVDSLHRIIAKTERPNDRSSGCGRRGVLCKDTLFYATISVGSQKYEWGPYSTENEAACAFDRYSFLLHGAKAVTNRPLWEHLASRQELKALVAAVDAQKEKERKDVSIDKLESIPSGYGSLNRHIGFRYTTPNQVLGFRSNNNTPLQMENISTPACVGEHPLKTPVPCIDDHVDRATVPIQSATAHSESLMTPAATGMIQLPTINASIHALASSPALPKSFSGASAFSYHAHEPPRTVVMHVEGAVDGGRMLPLPPLCDQGHTALGARHNTQLLRSLDIVAPVFGGEIDTKKGGCLHHEAKPDAITAAAAAVAAAKALTEFVSQPSAMNFQNSGGLFSGNPFLGVEDLMLASNVAPIQSSMAVAGIAPDLSMSHSAHTDGSDSTEKQR